MKNKLPVLTAVTLLGAALGYLRYQQQAAEAPPPAGPPIADASQTASPSQPTAGDQLLLRARTELERRASITARLRHQVSLGGRHLFGVGGYWQQGAGEDMHIRLELQLADQKTGFLQVSNGRLLWTDQRLPSGRQITRLDLRKVRSIWSRDDDEFDDLAAGRAIAASPEPEISIRDGGLPTLLLSLSDCFTFLPPESMRWTPSPPLAGMPESLPVFAIVGRWKPDVLKRFVPGLADIAALPERLPQEVLVLFGQSDLFPYRIEFRRFEPTPFQLSSEPLALLEFFGVSFDAPIAAVQFDYPPPRDAEWDDRTTDYIEALRLQRQTRLAKSAATANQK